jgi:hypothetical protein
MNEKEINKAGDKLGESIAKGLKDGWFLKMIERIIKFIKIK